MRFVTNSAGLFLSHCLSHFVRLRAQKSLCKRKLSGFLTFGKEHNLRITQRVLQLDSTIIGTKNVKMV